jgi:hypothetical protein
MDRLPARRRLLVRQLLTPRRARILVACATPLLLVGSLAAALVLVRPPARHAHAAPMTGLQVRGNQLVTGNGQPVRFLGMNRSGTEYACIQGWGIFDGPSDAASVAAMAAWHINSVRVLINEDCWLGINGVAAQYGGAAYQNAIVNYVQLLHQYGLYAELSLIWTAPGATQATYQREMPDTDHSIAMWQSVATIFKSDPNVVFGIFGEPHNVGWACWLNGGAACASDGLTYPVAGMQSLVTAIRGTGATQPISVPGIDWANNLSQWLQNEPSDPQHALMAEFHQYGDQTCASATCWNSQELPVLQQVPLLTGELGESVNGTCTQTFIDTYMAWADAHGVGYQGWTWDTWGGCGVLITGYSGTPTSGFGQGYQAHLAQLGASSAGDAPGVFHPATSTFLLRNSLTAGPADETVKLGTSSMYPIAGDWTGSGVDRVGVYDSSTATFSLATSNASGASLITFTFGEPGDIPIVGDWTGSGHDGVGVFRPSNGVIYLTETLATGYSTYAMVFGKPGDVPLAGDWSGQGHDTVGIYRPSNGRFYLTNTNCNCIPTANYAVTFGTSGDAPFTGDWTHSGKTGLGVFRDATGQMFLRSDAITTGKADFTLAYGASGDKPIAGHWA